MAKFFLRQIKAAQLLLRGTKSPFMDREVVQSRSRVAMRPIHVTEGLIKTFSSLFQYRMELLVLTIYGPWHSNRRSEVNLAWVLRQVLFQEKLFKITAKSVSHTSYTKKKLYRKRIWSGQS